MTTPHAPSLERLTPLELHRVFYERRVREEIERERERQRRERLDRLERRRSQTFRRPHD